jgi:hypothetical protein
VAKEEGEAWQPEKGGGARADWVGSGLRIREREIFFLFVCLLFDAT